MINAVIFYAPKQKPLNGTLFYSYEYFCFLKSLNENIDFYIIYEDKNNIELIKNCLENKYIKNFNINFIKKIDLIRIPFNKVIILDKLGFENTVFSYKKLFVFLETSSKLIKPECKKYGYYDYQEPFDFKDELMLFLKNQKQSNNGEKTFITSVKPNDIDKRQFDDKFIFKKTEDFIYDIFSKINKVLYVHNAMDTNNRIIVESFYHKKNIEFQDIDKSINMKDSVIDRYNKCLEFGEDYFDIKNSKLIQDYIND